MSTTTVRSFLEGALKTYADSASLQLAIENAPFTKPETGSFLEYFLIPATTVNPDVASQRKREVGIFQVNIWTKSGIGTGAANTIAQGIIQAFPVVPKGTVSIEKTPDIGRGILDPSGWYILPVTISYRYES